MSDTRGLHPVYLFRLSQRADRKGHSRIAHLLESINYIIFRAILPPGVTGGAGLGLNHRGLNVVIHPLVDLGSNVRLQHGVTLATDRPLNSGERMLIGDHVAIGAGSILLGPIRVGDRAIIGAGSVVTKDVPARQVWAGNPARYIRDETANDRPWLTMDEETPTPRM